MASIARGGGWDEDGFVAGAATAAAAPPAAAPGQRPSPAAAAAADVMDAMSGLLRSPGRAEGGRSVSAYSSDLGHALKSVVKARAAARTGARCEGAASRARRAGLLGHARQPPLSVAPPHPAQVFTTTASPNFSAPWQMQAQSKCTASGFAIAPLSSRRILTNAHAVANEVRRVAWAQGACARPMLLPCRRRLPHAKSHVHI